MAQLQARALVKVLRDGKREFRLEIPRFDLAPGDRKAIVGRTGAGKTTALDVLALASSPDSAETLTVTDRENVAFTQLHTANARTLARLRARNFGYVLQTNPLFAFLDLRANALLSQRINRQTDEDYLRFLLATLELDLPGSTRISEMSVGQRQRLSIVRALAHRPPFVLCDEPTAALDEETANILMKLLGRLADEQEAAILIVTHDEALVSRFGFERNVITPRAGKQGESVLQPGARAA